MTYAWKWSHTEGTGREIVKGMILQSSMFSKNEERIFDFTIFKVLTFW